MHRSAKLRMQRGDLPVGLRSPLAHMIPAHTPRDEYPDDRALQAKRNQQERAEKAARGELRRRTVAHVPALLEETLDVEYAI